MFGSKNCHEKLKVKFVLGVKWFQCSSETHTIIKTVGKKRWTVFFYLKIYKLYIKRLNTIQYLQYTVILTAIWIHQDFYKKSGGMFDNIWCQNSNNILQQY